MKQLIPIGRFSQITQLSLRMLRHYDELNLLKPAQIDPQSGYRYYSIAQALEAEKIRLLRSLEVPLEEIRQLLSLRDADAVRVSLARHRARLEAQITQYQQALDKLERLSTHELAATYPVVLRSLEAQPVITERIVTALSDIQLALGRTYGALYGHLGHLGVRPSGPPFLICFEREFKEGPMEFAVGVPTEVRLPSYGSFESDVLPASLVASTLHVGPYSEITHAYQAVLAWIDEHGYVADAAAREVYLVGVGQVQNPAEYRTELVWPVLGA